MKRWNFGWTAGVGGRESMAIAVAFAVAITGCSLFGKKPEPASAASEPTATSMAPDQPTDSMAPPGPEAKIQISYSKPNDFLNTLSMTKYSGADILTTSPSGSNGTASVVRFEGGMPVWQVDIEQGMFSEMPFGVSAQNYAVSEVKFGHVPPHFVQVIPEHGPPEPLEPGHFYIFSVTRKSGSISYDAVKVNSDGSLQAYEADPRAGSSFRLCCNVSSDFSVTPPALDAPLPPPDVPEP